MAQLFTNNSLTIISSPISNVETTIVLAPGTGSKFPPTANGDFFFATITNAGIETAWEVVKVTNRLNDTLTVVRAQENTTALSWSSGAKFEMRLTAVQLSNFMTRIYPLQSYEGSYNNRHYRDVADYASSVTPVTGTIKISLPVTWTNSRIQATVVISDLNMGSDTITIQGKNALAGTAWVDTSARSSDNNLAEVRLGHDGTNCCILIGDLTTSWSHPKVLVTDVIVSEDGQDWDLLIKNTAVSMIVTEAGITVSASPVVNTPAFLVSGVKAVSTTYTANLTDTVILGSTSVAPFTITLPPAASCAGKQFAVGKADASANVLTVDANASETINGLLSLVLGTQFDSYLITSNGSNWVSIGGSGGAGAKGGGPDKVFYENDQAVTADYSVTQGKNAMTAGPITINTGVSVTVPSGSVWTVI